MTRQKSRYIRIVALGAVTALTVAACGSSGAAGEQGAADGSPQTEFTIELTEFAYSPSNVTFPAGETVTLTLKNTGTIPHEFMLGGDAMGEGGYMEDLLGQLDPEVISGRGYIVEGLESADHSDGEEDNVDPASDAANKAHGAEIELEPGGEITLRLTIPADAAGSYEMGCFLPGHYEAGMKGTVTIEG